MKMSKKTRIMSVLLCIALMMGVMSVGMMANAANDADALFTWKSGGYWYSSQNQNATDTITDGAISITANESVSGNMFQVGAWSAGSGCFTTANVGTATEGKTGIAAAVRIDNALAPDGGWNPPSLDVVLKLTVTDEGTYSYQFNGVPVGGGKAIVVFPFENFKNENPSGTGVKNDPLGADSLTKVTNVEFDVVSYGSYYGNSFNSLEVTISPFYAYTDEPSDIALPGEGDEPESTTAEPTTEAPTTEAPTTEAPITEAPTTVAPAPTTAAPAPTTVAPAPTTAAVKAAKPAKVKKVTAKSKAKKKVVVTWAKAKNAKKYIVKYSYKKNMKSAKTVTVKKAKATLKKLKSGKKVYIQVQGVNGKVKGKFSAKKSVKVK